MRAPCRSRAQAVGATGSTTFVLRRRCARRVGRNGNRTKMERVFRIMKKRSAAFVAGILAVAVAAASAGTVLAQGKSKEEQKREKELQEAMQREARPVVMAVNAFHLKQGSGDAQAVMVNPRENDLGKAITPATPAVEASGLRWRYDTMKAADGKVYVPFTLDLPANAVPQGPVSVYFRVVEQGSQPPGAAAEREGGEAAKAEEAQSDEPAFEDFFTFEPRAASGQGIRLMRAFAAPPGAYDIYVGMRAKQADSRRQNDPVRVVTLKDDVTLPDFWNGELTTSSVLVTGKVDQVQGEVTPDIQRERPYVFGQMEFVPSMDNRFQKADELSVLFQIYNPGLEAGKPNVTVEYSFHQKLAAGEKYFNKTSPQQLNAQTLPATLDVTATQMLPGGQSVPLASFPPGDYRMEIKITDAIAKKTITRNINFTVLGA
jgi:hypothetical protein